MAQRRVKIIKPYIDKEMAGVYIPEGIFMYYEDKKADKLIKKAFAVDAPEDDDKEAKPIKKR